MAEEFEPYGDDDRKLMWRVLAAWVKATRPPPNSALFRELRTDFIPVRADALENSMLHSAMPVRLETSGWIIGECLTRESNVFPVITFEAGGSKTEVKEAAFRVALFRSMEDGRCADGWRFEQAEEPNDDGSIASHPYSHAQAIMGWRKGVNCLIHAPHPENEPCCGISTSAESIVNDERHRAKEDTLVKHPAFPLGVVTLTGLSLAVFNSLYGAVRGREVFGGIRALSAATGSLRDDLERLSILQQP